MILTRIGAAQRGKPRPIYPSPDVRPCDVLISQDDDHVILVGERVPAARSVPGAPQLQPLAILKPARDGAGLRRVVRTQQPTGRLGYLLDGFHPMPATHRFAWLRHAGDEGYVGLLAGGHQRARPSLAVVCHRWMTQGARYPRLVRRVAVFAQQPDGRPRERSRWQSKYLTPAAVQWLMAHGRPYDLRHEGPPPWLGIASRRWLADNSLIERVSV